MLELRVTLISNTLLSALVCACTLSHQELVIAYAATVARDSDYVIST